MSSPAIQASGLIKAYDGEPVLKQLNWEVPTGSVVGLLGRNGSGKSTLLHCLSGITRANAGEVRVLGQDAAMLDATLKQRIGFVPQVSDDLGWMRVDQALDYTGLFYTNWRTDWVRDKANEWGLSQSQKLSSLSQGQRQKVSILRALGHDPDLLLLDEPVAALDPVARRAFIAQLVELAFDERKTIVFSTHITSDLERIAADVAVLRNGTIAFNSSIDDMKERVVRLRFGKDNPDELGLTDVLNVRRMQGHSVVTVQNYSPAVDQHLRSLGVAVSVEHLNLEDIFMELEG